MLFISITLIIAAVSFLQIEWKRSNVSVPPWHSWWCSACDAFWLTFEIGDPQTQFCGRLVTVGQIQHNCGVVSKTTLWPFSKWKLITVYFMSYWSDQNERSRAREGLSTEGEVCGRPHQRTTSFSWGQMVTVTSMQCELCSASFSPCL